MGRVSRRRTLASKGQAKIVAVLLLVVVAAVTAVITYLWTTSFAGELSQEAGEETVSTGRMLKVEGVRQEGNNLVVYVRNIGDTTTTIDRVYLLSPGGVVLASLEPQEGPIEVSPSEVVAVRVQVPDDLVGKEVVVSLSERGGTSVCFKVRGETTTAAAKQASLASKPWLKGWQYRRPINVTERSGVTLTDYPVRIVLVSSNFDFFKAKPDGSDLRFTASDGVTLLSYWVESWGEGSAVVWVKVPEIPAGSTVTIYMYYGNPNAENEGDPKSVFTFYDDVESGGDGWEVESEYNGLWHVTSHRHHSPGHAWYYGREGHWDYNVGTTRGYILSPPISLDNHQGALLTFWTWWEHEKYPWGSFDSLDVYVCVDNKCKKVWHRDCNEGPQKADWHQETIDISAYAGKTIRIKFRFNSVDSLYNYYEGWYIDDIVVRNYVKPEPSVTIGAEETP